MDRMWHIHILRYKKVIEGHVQFLWQFPDIFCHEVR